MNKVKINGKEFYVISTAECLVARHNLCVAVEPWGELSYWLRRKAVGSNVIRSVNYGIWMGIDTASKLVS